MPMTPLGLMSRLRYYLPRRFADWRRAARADNELSHLSDRCLRDIGVYRHSSTRARQYEKCKPFWMP